MTIDIADLRELHTSTASSLPWRVAKGDEADAIVTEGGMLTWDDHGGEVFAALDAELIVAAVNALPALLDELERLRAVTDEQVTTAARAMYEEAYGEGDWEYAHPIEANLYLRRARTALDAARQAGGASFDTDNLSPITDLDGNPVGEADR